MWSLYQKAKTFSRLPSEILRMGDEWMSWQFDNCCTLFGAVIENALQEQQNTGTEREPKWRAKYTLAQLLDDAFRLPAPVVERPQNGIQGLLAMAGKGVKVIRVKG